MSALAGIGFHSTFTLLTMLGASDVGATDEVLHWNRVVTDATAASAIAGDPLTESRIFAIVHVAMHDAVSAIDPTFEPYAAKLPMDSGASIEAAVATAAHAALGELLPACRPSIDAALRDSLAAIGDGAAKASGIEIGRRSAAAILAARKDDGYDAKVDYRPGSKPGDYRPTPPDFTPAWMTQWGNVKPFVLETSAQFRPEPPPAVGSPQALWDIDEVRKAGVKENSSRSDEQSEIARYWYENSTQGWNRIAREAATPRHLGMVANARLFALLNLTMAEGYIAVFEAKYHYNYWRPATAIRAAGDAEWINYLPTPPIPDYPSGHTVLGAAAATLLARALGSDFADVSMTCGAPNAGITRHFWSFSEAAWENGNSRILAGIHFRTAVNAGYRQGEQIGTWVFEHALRPRAAASAKSALSSR